MMICSALDLFLWQHVCFCYQSLCHCFQHSQSSLPFHQQQPGLVDQLQWAQFRCLQEQLHHLVRHLLSLEQRHRPQQHWQVCARKLAAIVFSEMPFVWCKICTVLLKSFILCMCGRLKRICTHIHTHRQPFYCSSAICPGPPGWAGTRKVKPGRLKPICIYWSKR